MSRRFIVGIDEVGRGPIAGPVTVAAVLVENNKLAKLGMEFDGVRDSKKLSEKKREEWFEKILERKLPFSVSFTSAGTVDKQGIVASANSSVSWCLKKLNADPKETDVILDAGLKAPAMFEQEQIIKGDETYLPITLASIVAKVLRDRRMVLYSKKYPGYGFEKHKGYGTRHHYEMLQKLGVSEIHRRSFLST